MKPQKECQMDDAALALQAFVFEAADKGEEVIVGLRSGSQIAGRPNRTPLSPDLLCLGVGVAEAPYFIRWDQIAMVGSVRPRALE